MVTGALSVETCFKDAVKGAGRQALNSEIPSIVDAAVSAGGNRVKESKLDCEKRKDVDAGGPKEGWRRVSFEESIIHCVP